MSTSKYNDIPEYGSSFTSSSMNDSSEDTKVNPGDTYKSKLIKLIRIESEREKERRRIEENDA